MKYIITGINSGLGKYLYENIPNSLGINRKNLLSVISRINADDVIVHCAFNKKMNIDDHYSYLNDNIFLTQKLLELSNRMIYISSVDIYKQENTYALFKKFAESIVSKYDNSLIVRCPFLLGKYMNTNHLSKIKENIQCIGLCRTSTFNYINYDDVLNFVTTTELKGICDLVSKGNVVLNDIKKFFNSTTVLGTYRYETTNHFDNPIYTGRSSIQTIEEYYK